MGAIYNRAVQMVLWQSGKTRAAALKLQMQSKHGGMRRGKTRRRQMNSVGEEDCMLPW